MPCPNPGTEFGSTHGGVRPVLVLTLTSARRSTSSFTTSGWFSRTATISAVCWNSGSFVSTDRPAIEQDFHRLEIPDARGGHQRGFPGPVGLIGIGSDLEQQPDHVRVAVRAREIERCHAIPIGARRIGAGANEQPRRFQIVDPNQPVQGRRAVAAWRVDVHLLVDQRADGGGVAPHGRFREADVAWRLRGAQPRPQGPGTSRA